MRKRTFLILSFLWLLLIAGCEIPTYEADAPAVSGKDVKASDFQYLYENVAGSTENLSERDDVHLVLALSGSGAKGTAFTFGILEALYDIKSLDGTSSLLDEVNVISAVSSATGVAMSYGLFGSKIFEKETPHYVLESHPFHWNTNELNFVTDVLKTEYGLGRFLSLPFGRYSIPDIVSDYFVEEIFDNETYEGLVHRLRLRGGKPFIILSAADIVRGQQFEFTQPQFDMLCSDLAQVRVGRAVAAASIPPILTTGVRFRNFPSDGCRPYEKLEIDRIEEVLQNWSGQSKPINSYLRHKTAVYRGRTSYVHLTDASLIDSLALRPIVDGLTRWGTAWSIRRVLKNEKPRSVLIVVANMRNRFPAEASFDDDAPHPLKQVFPVLSLAASTQSKDQFKLARFQLMRTIELIESAKDSNISKGTEFYDPVFLNSASGPDRDQGDCLETFEIQDETLKIDMIQVKRLARRVLHTNEAFGEFLKRNPQWTVVERQEPEIVAIEERSCRS